MKSEVVLGAPTAPDLVASLQSLHVPSTNIPGVLGLSLPVQMRSLRSRYWLVPVPSKAATRPLPANRSAGRVVSWTPSRLTHVGPLVSNRSLAAAAISDG